MNISKNVKLVIFVPLTHCNIVREVLGNAGAGKIGNYDFCSFSTRGTGRYIGNEKSDPAIGKAMEYESAEEEKIEVLVPRDILEYVLISVRKVHPYEEVAYDIYTIEDLN
jgi:hypothetical protein